MPIPYEEVSELLDEWLADPEQLDDAGIDPPTVEILNKAKALIPRLAEIFPTEVKTVWCVPTCDGGVSMTVKSGTKSYILEIWDDGEVVFVTFEGSKVVDKEVIEDV